MIALRLDGSYQVGPATFAKREDARQYLREQLNITPAEWVVLQALARGLRYKEIAAECRLSPKTIEAQATSLRRKTKTGDRVGLVLWAFRSGLIDPPSPEVH